MSSLSVTPTLHHIGKNFRHDVAVLYNQFQQSKYSNCMLYPLYSHRQLSVQYLPWPQVKPQLFPDFPGQWEQEYETTTLALMNKTARRSQWYINSGMKQWTELTSSSSTAETACSRWYLKSYRWQRCAPGNCSSRYISDGWVKPYITRPFRANTHQQHHHY